MSPLAARRRTERLSARLAAIPRPSTSRRDQTDPALSSPEGRADASSSSSSTNAVAPEAVRDEDPSPSAADSRAAPIERASSGLTSGPSADATLPGTFAGASAATAGSSQPVDRLDDDDGDDDGDDRSSGDRHPTPSAASVPAPASASPSASPPPIPGAEDLPPLDSPLLDRPRLAPLVKSQPDLLVALQGALRTSVRETLEALKSAVEAQDLEGQIQWLHKLKGSLSQLTIEDLRERVAAWYAACRAGAPVPRWQLDHLRSVINRLDQEFDAWIVEPHAPSATTPPAAGEPPSNE